MELHLTRRGAEVPRCPDVDKKVRTGLTVSPFSPMDPYPKRFKVWAETPTKYIVPVHWALEAFPDMVVKDTRAPGVDIDVAFAGQLREDLHQPRAVASVLDQWTRTDGAMLCAIPGAGKTSMALYLAAHVGKKTLVVVHTSTLREQWKERVRQFLPAASVTEVQGPKCDTTGDVVIAMFQTLASRQYPSSTFRDFHLLVVDECFPARQMVATETGAVTIRQIYKAWKEGKTVNVFSFDETSKTFVLKPVTHAWEKTTTTGLVKIEYSKSNIKATPNHRILCTDGWKNAGEIRTGDLMVARYAPGLSEQAVALAMNPDQYQMFLGSLLGDGHLGILPSGRRRLTVTHGGCQREYCKWKASVFDGTVREFVGGYNNTVEVQFSSKVIDLPRHKTWTSQKSHLSQWVLDEMDDRAMAIWYMDDGSLGKCGRIVFSTHTFDQESHERLCSRLADMGFPAICAPVVKNGKTFFTTRMNQPSGSAFLSRIARYIHPSMRYKVENARTRDMHTARLDGADMDDNNNYGDFSAVPRDLLTHGKTLTINNRQYEWKHGCCEFGFHPLPRRKCLKRKALTWPDLDSACTYVWNTAFLDYGTVAVSAVSRYTPVDKRVYDLEVADTHTFVCSGISGNGPVVHNCHHVGAQVLTQALFGLAFPRVLGLSATPTRKDRLTDVMHWFLGPTAFSQTRENQGTTSVVTVKYTSPRYAAPPPVKCRGDVDYTGIVSVLVDDDERTRVIAHEVASLARAGRDVLVLSHRREHCKAVCARVTEEGVDAMTYLGGDKVVPSSRVIVATFSLAAEGFDCPRLSALVLATPASDVEQACGRVMRGSSTRGAVIVDVVDQWGVCFAQAAKRRALYKRSGFTFAAAAACPAPVTTDATFAFIDG